MIPFFVENDNYSYTAEDLMNFYEDKDIQVLTLINPDNPSGNYIEKKDVLRIAEWCNGRGVTFIVDESFVDFAERDGSTTLLTREILNSNPKLIVVKSISKSYGVPGIRLGIAASADKDLIEAVKKDVSIWNINSFGEFFLQIQEKYQKDYVNALKKFYDVRREYIRDLEGIDKIRVIPSQANYVLCEVLGGMSSRMLTEILLNDYNILIKDLSTKKGFNGKNYIRLAVRTDEDNKKLVNALESILPCGVADDDE